MLIKMCSLSIALTWASFVFLPTTIGSFLKHPLIKSLIVVTFIWSMKAYGADSSYFFVVYFTLGVKRGSSRAFDSEVGTL